MKRSAVLLALGMSLVGMGVGMTGCSSSDRSTERAQALDKETILPEAYRLVAVVDSAEARGFTGSVLVMRAGRILLHRGVGWIDESHSRHTDLADPRPVGSIRRGFIAAALLALREDGKVLLDESVQRFLPGIPENMRDITVGMLLRHTSGLVDGSDLPETGDLRAAVKRAFESPLKATPGVRFHESGAGYLVLAQVVQVATGESFGDFVQQRLLAPAGLVHTHVDEGAGGSGTANLLSTAGDLYRWYTAMFESDVVLTPESRTLLVTSHARRGPLEVGFGWFITHTARDTRRISNLSDSGEPSNAVLSWYPDEDAVIILLGANPGSDVADRASSIAGRLESALLSDDL